MTHHTTTYNNSSNSFLHLWKVRMTFLFLIMTVMGVGSAWAQTHTEKYDYNGDGVEETYNVVFLDFKNGNNDNDGSASDKAVKDWANAYKKLPKYTGTTDADRDTAWDSNIIVLVDNTATAHNITITEANAKGSGSKGIPATITGVWPWTDVDGAKVKNGGKIYLGSTNGTSRIGADTKFKYVRFAGGANSYLNLHLFNTTFDVGCSMDDFKNYLLPANGALKENAAPDVHLMMYDDTHDFTSKPWPNPTKPMKLTIRSGKFGRILSCRTTGTTNDLIGKRYVIGTPQYPLMGIMELDIDPLENAKWNTNTKITHDIAFCCAGSTQGTEYCDIHYDIKRAKIGKLVSATQGMNIKAAEDFGLSCSSFFGRTVINLIPAGWETGTANNNDIVIEQYYGACLGRSGTTSGMCNAAFYGTSQLNMYGGTIKSGAYLSAGGISGLKSPDGKYYTTDKFIPYPDNDAKYASYPFNGIRYQPYDANKTIVEFTTRMDGTEKKIDLANTVTEFNIYGGIINGGLYGGSYGYSDVLTVTYALPGAGSMWGTTNVNIYGGTINGGVYGGGFGSTAYYTNAANDKKVGFLTVASVYGNTNVNIYGGKLDNKGIYGGGAGVASTGTAGTDTEFLNIAKVYGNTNVLIEPKTLKNRAEWANPDVPEFIGPDEDWTFTGDIYGGGALGAVEGNTNVIIKGGNITGNVFGAGEGESGHPNKAKVTGNTLANIQGGTQGDEYAVYGGAQMALVDGNTAVILQGGTVGNAYGGGLGTNTMAANVTGDATVQLGSNDGTTASKVLGSIFGANNLNGTPEGHVLVHVLKTAPRDGQGTEEYDVAAVYGGGNLAAYVPSDATLADNDKNFAEVLIENCDNSIEYVYGGGNAAPVPATKVTIVGANAIDNAFAGGNGAGADNPGADIGYKGFFSSGAATEYGTGIATINVQGGKIHHVYGGSNTLGYIKDHAVVNVNAAGTCTMDVAELYGGGKMAPGKAATINIACTGEGKIDNVYGGAHMANLTGNIELNIRGGNIGNAFGGNNVSGNIDGAITVNVNWTTGDDACGTNSLNNVYGGGNKADYTGSPAVNILNGTVNENVFGGGLEATVTGNPIVTVNGGTVSLGAYGGGALADVDGMTTVNVVSGTVSNAYGGGLGQLADAGAGKEAIAAIVTGDASVTVSGGITTNVFGCNNLNGSPKGEVTVTIQTDANVTNVYGGGNQAAASVSPVVNINGGTSDKVYGGGYGATAVLTGSPTVNVSGGTVSHDVYGGGALANVKGTPTVNVSGGTVTHDVYGGGALADVNGNTTVNLTGGAVGGAYGGALGSAEVAAKVNGDTYVHLDGSKVTETGIFGANNLNGTPTGHVKVHVTRTTPRDGFEYAVPAVYGGGNLSAYVPTNTEDFAEVLIENCDNSIEYVYGGGNAAPVPATKVTIYGANAINNAFAGGNGAGDGNPGADVGYKGYYSKGSREEYGSGTAYLTIYGGTVHKAYGGSNTLGYIRTKTTVELAERPADYEGTPCDLNVGEVHGGGNEAEMYCDGEVILGCTEGADKIFAGAKDADIHGNLTLNITSGTFGQVFGGNDSGGAIEGAIAVNVDETGCFPVIIGELYSCGNEAAYSVYGYNDDGTPIIDTTAEKKYDDPKINIIACTYIGKIFGGGNGKGARLYGSPTVNINPIKGTFAGKETTPLFVLKDGGVTREANSDPMSIPDDVGEIGTIYGGGNDADVYGDTHVNIGLKSMNHHVTGSDIETESEVSVNITGNVFGGGNKAVVTGDTNVTIGK